MSRTSTAKMYSNFFLSFILDGLILNSGYIFYAIIKTWRKEGQVSIMPLNVNKAISGIIGAIILTKACSKDSRSVILWGSLLCATGIGLCSIAKEISWLILFWGTVFGTGYGIASTCLQKELAASGQEPILKILLQCAPNMGNVVFPFVLEMLFHEYDLTGSCLLLCGIVLNYIPLSLLAFYNIEPRMKKIKWTMRKRSSKYKLNNNNQTNISVIQSLKHKNSFRNKVLASCLEPDIVCHKLSVDNEAFENDYDKFASKGSMEKETHSKIFESKEVILNEPVIGLDNNMEMLEKQNNSGNDAKLSQLILDIEKYEHDHTIFEEDYYAKDTIVNNDSSQVVDCLNENSNAENSISDQGDKNLYCDLEVASNAEITNNDTGSIKRSSTSCPNSVSTLSQSNANETPLSSVKQIEQFSPDMFKVNVLEYTFESESDYEHQTSNLAGKSFKKNNYRHHANSLITQCYDNIDFSKINSRNKEIFSKNKVPSRQNENIYNIYEIEKYDITYEIPKRAQAITNEYRNQRTNFFYKLKVLLKTFQLLTNMECLLFLVTTVIYEYVLTTLIVLICIFAEEARVKETYFKWIISAFGVGGILGKFCFYYINKNLEPRIAITSAIFFMLNSLTIIGILWSSTLKWFIHFYFILGILQGCILSSFTKIREIYIDEKSNLFLSSACKLSLSVTILSLPYLIRFTTSLSGDFELLLEILSCCSVFCSVFCFSLQKFPRSCFCK